MNKPAVKEDQLETIAVSSYAGLSEYQETQLLKLEDKKKVGFVKNVANIVSFCRLGLEPTPSILKGDVNLANIVNKLYLSLYREDGLEKGPYQIANVLYDFLQNTSNKGKKSKNGEKGMKELAKALLDALSGNPEKGENKEGGSDSKEEKGEFKSSKDKEAEEEIEEMLSEVCKNPQVSEEDYNRLKEAHLEKTEPGGNKRRGYVEWDGTYKGIDSEVLEKAERALHRSTKMISDFKKVLKQPISFKECLGHMGVIDTPRDEKERLKNDVFGIFEKMKALNSQGKITSKKRTTPSRRVKMRSMSQLPRLANRQTLVRVDFDIRLMKKSLQISEKERKATTTLALIIDDSGSMSDEFKMRWVKTIIMHRCIEAEKLGADLYLGCFLGNVSQLRKVSSLKEGLDYFNNVWSASGWTTNVEKSIINTYKKIQPLMDPGGKLEIMVINDGQDKVHPEKWDFNFTVHALMLGLENKDLKTGVLSTGGLYGFLDETRSYFYEK